MLKKLMNKKKNNKGFSLVELIVVVLIIAIIAVALAPQVMKWVGTSKTSVDANNIASLKSSVAIAVANAQSKGYGVNLAKTEIISTKFPYTEDASISNIETAIGNVLNGDYPKTADQKSTFSVTITSAGGITVERTTP